MHWGAEGRDARLLWGDCLDALVSCWVRSQMEEFCYVKYFKEMKSSLCESRFHQDSRPCQEPPSIRRLRISASL
jgi:hypothetical protein